MSVLHSIYLCILKNVLLGFLIYYQPCVSLLYTSIGKWEGLMQYLILPNFGLHSESSTLVQELNAMVHVSVPKKYWQHRQLTWSHVRKWPPIPNCLEFEEYRGDLFHGIHKGHEQQMEIQHAALTVTCSLQTCMYLNYIMSRQHYWGPAGSNEHIQTSPEHHATI